MYKVDKASHHDVRRSIAPACLQQVQWPPPELCPLCRLPGAASAAAQGAAALQPDWNEDEVYRFLIRFFGEDPGRTNAAASLFGASRRASRALRV